MIVLFANRLFDRWYMRSKYYVIPYYHNCLKKIFFYSFLPYIHSKFRTSLKKYFYKTQNKNTYILLHFLKFILLSCFLIRKMAKKNILTYKKLRKSYFTTPLFLMGMYSNMFLWIPTESNLNLTPECHSRSL